MGYLFLLLQNFCPTVEAANLYAPPLAIVTVWLNALALLFAVTALYYQPFWENKKYIYAFAATAVLFSIFALLDYIPGVELFTRGASIKEGRYTLDYSSWSMLSIIWLSMIGLFVATYLLKGYKDGSPVVRRQIKIVGVTVIIVSVISFFFNQHFIAGPLRFTDFVLVPFDILLAYFILRHKLVPIDTTLNVLSETIGEGFIMCNPEGIVFNINKRARRILGLDSKEDLLNKKWDIVVSSSPDALNNPNIIKEMNQRLQEDPSQTLEIEILFGHPMERFIHIFTSALMDDAGRLLGRFFILTDLTSKRKSEQKLKLSEDKYRNLIESANDAIISTDYAGIIQSFNRKAEEVYGYSREEIIGKHLLILTPESYEKEIEGLLDDFLKKGRSELAEKVLVVPAKRRDGREIIVEITFSSTPAEEGQLITVIARDVTERKEMEEKLLRSEKLRALGELAGGVAHDFNNILAAILGRSQLLKMSLRDDSWNKGKKQTLELNKGLEIIERAASDGAETVRRIQEFSRRRDD
ncbi:MAG: PAS domain S-box protein, partial [Deltaproteobacteria bacterium]|nr:PAS domain S-box protein [Deltaproteobacteria bacterium]